MQSDYHYLAPAGRATPKAWAETDTPALLQTASAKTREILKQPARPVVGADKNKVFIARFAEIRDAWSEELTPKAAGPH